MTRSYFVKELYVNKLYENTTYNKNNRIISVGPVSNCSSILLNIIGSSYNRANLIETNDRVGYIQDKYTKKVISFVKDCAIIYFKYEDGYGLNYKDLVIKYNTKQKIYEIEDFRHSLTLELDLNENIKTFLIKVFVNAVENVFSIEDYKVNKYSVFKLINFPYRPKTYSKDLYKLSDINKMHEVDLFLSKLKSSTYKQELDQIYDRKFFKIREFLNDD